MITPGNYEQVSAAILKTIEGVCRRHGVRVTWNFDVAAGMMSAGNYHLNWRARRMGRLAMVLSWIGLVIALGAGFAPHLVAREAPVWLHALGVGISGAAIVLAAFGRKIWPVLTFEQLERHIVAEIALKHGLVTTTNECGNWVFADVADADEDFPSP